MMMVGSFLTIFCARPFETMTITGVVGWRERSNGLLTTVQEEIISTCFLNLQYCHCNIYLSLSVVAVIFISIHTSYLWLRCKRSNSIETRPALWLLWPYTAETFAGRFFCHSSVNIALIHTTDIRSWAYQPSAYARQRLRQASKQAPGVSLLGYSNTWASFSRGRYTAY